jgi:hypothetical protein
MSLASEFPHFLKTVWVGKAAYTFADGKPACVVLSRHRFRSAQIRSKLVTTLQFL